MLTRLSSLKNHDGFIRYFKNSSWLLGEKILRMTVGLFVGVWVARYLGPEQFGLFSYAQSFVGLFTAIATLGLDGIVVRELVKDDSRRDELLGTAFYLKLTGAIVVLITLAVAVTFTSNDTYTNLLIFIIASATIFQAFNVVDMYFQAKVLSKYVVFANIATLFLSSILKIALILLQAPLIAFVWMVLFDSLILACGFIYFYLIHFRHYRYNCKSRKKTSIKKLTFKKWIAVSLLKDSWPLILSGGILMIQARIDQVMIQEFRGSVEVGYYSVAMKLIEAMAFMPMLMKNSLFPAIQNAKNQSEELYQKRLLNFYRLNFILFLVFSIPIFLFAESIVVKLFGQDYHPAGVLLSLLAIRLFFANMGVARSVYILCENFFKFSLITMAIGTVVNIIFNYLWIPNYGAKGAIVATIISFFITIYLVDIFHQKTRSNVFLQVRGMFTFFKLNFKD